MLNRITTSALSLMLIAMPLAASAFGGEDSISINRPTLDICDGVGTAVTFTVDVTHSGLNDRVVVTVDGEVVLGPTTDDDEEFTIGSLVVGVGEHAIEATVYDSLLGDLEDEDIIAHDEYSFDVDCTRGGLALLDDENRSIYQSDQPDQGGTDCCPGSDSGSSEGNSSSSEGGVAAKVAKTVGKVKGATTQAVSAVSKLKALNSVFRSVYGRTPAFDEWTYWAKRMLNDKPQLDALYGAMQWHKLHGQTIGA